MESYGLNDCIATHIDYNSTCRRNLGVVLSNFAGTGVYGMNPRSNINVAVGGMLRGMLATLIIVCGSVSTVRADFSFDLTVVADYEFAFLSNTPLNPDVKMTPFIPFQAKGVLTFSLDEAAINDPGATTVPFTSVTGILNGVSPAAFLPHQISPNLEFLGGNLTNIVRDSNGFITSATVEDLSMRWEMTGTPGGGSEVRLFTKVGLPFSGDVDGLPVSPGTVIAGADPFEGYLDLGGGASLLAVIGQNRTLTVVPEPGTLTLYCLAAGGLAACGAWRRRRYRSTVQK